VHDIFRKEPRVTPRPSAITSRDAGAVPVSGDKRCTVPPTLSGIAGPRVSPGHQGCGPMDTTRKLHDSGHGLPEEGCCCADTVYSLENVVEHVEVTPDILTMDALAGWHALEASKQTRRPLGLLPRASEAPI
jgi:hypothetical protein